jgi:single-strand DNA-binding protein
MATRGLNKATLLGHVGKDAELRYTNNGKPVATFSLATSEGYKDSSGNWQDKTTWHNIVAWDRLAEICGNYVKKGKQVYIEGRIQNRSYDDKEGNKKYVSEIVATELILLGGQGGERGSGESSYASQNNHSQTAAAQPVAAEDFDQNIPESDLPF